MMEQSPLALEILRQLGSHEAAREIEIGGGICLWHYMPYRRTNDVDAWWSEVLPESQAAIEQVMHEIATASGLVLSHRNQAAYQSWDLKQHDKTVFAFQIARKTRRLEPSVASPWGHLRLETLRENLGNKMTALVQRGAPRDMLDVTEVLRRGLLNSQECWELWQGKNPDRSAEEAGATLLKSLGALESRRPLAEIVDLDEREKARSTRAMIRDLAGVSDGD